MNFWRWIEFSFRLKKKSWQSVIWSIFQCLSIGWKDFFFSLKSLKDFWLGGILMNWLLHRILVPVVIRTSYLERLLTLRMCVIWWWHVLSRILTEKSRVEGEIFSDFKKVHAKEKKNRFTSWHSCKGIKCKIPSKMP